ncbi:MAG: TRAP transporter substrate-binding protein [Motiliproteus sp.]
MIKIKHIICFFSLFLLVVPVAQSEEILIKFSHVAAVNSPKGQMANKLKELVDERLKGKLKLEVYPNSQLFSDSHVLEAILLGDVQLAAPALSKFRKYTNKIQVFDLPFLFQDMVAVERFQNGPYGQKLLASMESKGIKGLGYFHNGMKQLTANSPLRWPLDVRGKKFRIMTSDVIAAQFKAVDAITIKKPYAEVFTLLQTNAIDGQENTWSNIYSKKFFEVQKYISETNHGVLDYMVVSSTEFWDSLPDDIRDELKMAVDEACIYGNQVAVAQAKSDRQKIIDSGRSIVISLQPKEIAEWVEVMQPVWKQFEPQLGKELIDAAFSSNQ